MHIAKENASQKNRTENITPWVFPEADFDGLERAAYCRLVFDEYFSQSGLSKDCIRGKTILEVGPGESLGVALLFISHGANQVICNDRFKSLLPPKYQSQIYRAILAGLKGEEESRCRQAVSESGNELFINPEYIKYKPVMSVEQLIPSVPRASIDVLISRAVLEHVFDLEDTMDAMYELLRPGGVMLHEVDFRDHGIFSRFGFNKLTFLTIPEATWRDITSNIGAPNRKHVNFFRRKLEQQGYQWSMREFVSDIHGNKILKDKLEAGKDYPIQFLNAPKWIRRDLQPEFAALSDEELALVGVFVKAQK